MDEKLIRMLIRYKDEFDRAPDNLSVGACVALLDLYIHRLVGGGLEESAAMNVLSAIFALRDSRELAALKQLHMAAALARRSERAKPQVPAAA